jgi:hypothetical protein
MVSLDLIAGLVTHLLDLLLCGGLASQQVGNIDDRRVEDGIAAAVIHCSVLLPLLWLRLGVLGSS